VIFELIEDAVKLTLIVAGRYFALGVYVRRKQPAWTEPLERRRLAVLWVLVLGASAIKVTEDVLGGESGPIDEAILNQGSGLTATAWLNTWREFRFPPFCDITSGEKR
jgi:hypothetical protein